MYVDIDPMVAAYGELLLAGDGTTTLITADLRDADAVLAHPELRRMIDFSQPVGVLMTAVMHFVEDSDDPWGLVAQYMGAMPPGSYLALSHATYDKLPPRAVQTIDDIYKNATSRIWLRSRKDIERFFDGLELVPPVRRSQSRTHVRRPLGRRGPRAGRQRRVAGAVLRRSPPSLRVRRVTRIRDLSCRPGGLDALEAE